MNIVIFSIALIYKIIFMCFYLENVEYEFVMFFYNIDKNYIYNY